MEEFRQALVGEVKLAGVPARPGGPRSMSASFGTQTLSPKASTTLSSATSEIDESVVQPARRKRLIAIGGGVAAAVVIGLLLLPKGHPKEELPQAALPAP